MITSFICLILAFVIRVVSSNIEFLSEYTGYIDYTIYFFIAAIIVIVVARILKSILK